jgi:hypothetical protein
MAKSTSGPARGAGVSDKRGHVEKKPRANPRSGYKSRQRDVEITVVPATAAVQRAVDAYETAARLREPAPESPAAEPEDRGELLRSEGSSKGVLSIDVARSVAWVIPFEEENNKGWALIMTRTVCGDSDKISFALHWGGKRNPTHEVEDDTSNCRDMFTELVE